ncbi:helix-turn-helix domain-containing protein [Pseudomonas hefeiensis]|uniref:Helix-turn-helix domain-containing protein n=1 Tax=Pseudomonas hefeiensis TaxID=2738125 RepID=A0ABY9GH74_9PSED|nr:MULTISPECIES: helix-turn-helix domain-containing protein [unclassified Pseudomonas]WLH14829.1 helix-turn-helix domain-containing protein [Pseudomonas sp. FP205]WLH97882.1 helix-turn-helix domain-containing protein [Pseudomonas sp. FP53]WLI42155.1 helix-turn-helix domain-containing protein [Pseudomonas sp. FP821]
MDRAKGTAVLDKTFGILEAIGLSTDGLDNQQLAAQLNLPRATLYRLLMLPLGLSLSGVGARCLDGTGPDRRCQF